MEAATGLEGMDALFAPRSIAVIGASDRERSPGAMVIRNLREGGFVGDIYPVSTSKAELQGVATIPSVEALPDGIDLTVISIPAPAVPGVIDVLGARGVRAALVLSSGFSETGSANLQQQLLDASRKHGMRIGGPNCSGYLNVGGRVGANFATWSPVTPLPHPGPIAVVSQSGGFGTVIARQATAAGLGYNWLLTTGNEVDVCVATAIHYAVEQENVNVVIGFAETIKNVEQLVRAAARANEMDKPIVLLKGARSEASQRAALSHTAAIAGSADAFDAVCRQTGIHIAESVDDLLDLGRMFTHRRRAKGRGVGIITSSGGAGVALSDAMGLAGLDVPEFRADEQAGMASIFPDEFLGSLSNPVDLSTQPSLVENPFASILERMNDSPTVAMLSPVVFHYAVPMVAGARAAFRASDKPMALFSTGPLPDATIDDPPFYTDPRRAARALAAVVRQSERQPVSSSADTERPPWVDKVRDFLARHAGRPMLLESDGMVVLGAAGVPVSPGQFVADSAEAETAFDALGGKPVAVKAMSYQVPHKSDVGGVKLGIASASDARRACAEVLASIQLNAPDVEIDGYLLQQMQPGRIELTAGMVRDPSYGPLIVLGIGGTMIEIMAERVLLRAPFDLDAARLAVREICDGRLVTGRRGLDEAEVEQFAQIGWSLGLLATHFPEIAAIDVNPLRVADSKVVATDALIELSAA